MHKNKDNPTIDFPSQPAPVKEVPVDVIINALKCIDAAAARGAYQGGELSSVGKIRDTLYTVVEVEIDQLVEAQKKEKAAAEEVQPEPAVSIDD